MDVTPVPKPVAEFAAMSGTDAATYTRERPGMSAFVLEDGVVYHAYSTYARGLDGLWGMYQWLDRAPKGRNETGVWWRRHDEYEPLPQNAGSCCHAAEAQRMKLASSFAPRTYGPVRGAKGNSPCRSVALRT